MKFSHCLLIFSALIITSCQGQPNAHYENISAQIFADKIKATPNAQIIDVRTPSEYGSQHIDNAKNINWNGDDFEAQASKLNKNEPVFVYCMVGGRSKKASDKLIEMGFSHVYDLEGGMMKWNASGMAKPSDKIVGMCPQEYGDMIKGSSKVLVDFYAPWCAPCKQMETYLLKMQTDLKGKVNIVRLNADEHKTMIADLKIDGLPVLLYYENGVLKWKHQGFMSEEELKKGLE